MASETVWRAGNSWTDRKTETAQPGHDKPQLRSQTIQLLRDPEQAGGLGLLICKMRMTLSCITFKASSTEKGIFILPSAKKEKKNNSTS